MTETTEHIKTVRTRDPLTVRLKQALQNPATIIREQNNRSFYAFLQYFWPQVSNDTFKTNWHIELLCDELQQLAERVAEGKPKLYDFIANVPPGSTKTITCSIMFVAWCWTRWYWMRFITVSYSAPLSLESAEYCRELIRSDEFRQIYPELDIKDDKDTKSNFRVVKKDYHYKGCVPRVKAGGNRFSTSVGGSVIGFHAHILIWDDPLDPKRAASEVELRKANHFIDRTLSTRKTDKAVSVTIGIMQRLHQDDPTGHLLSKKEKKLRHISLPGTLDGYESQLHPKALKRYYKRGLLDPVRMSASILKDMEVDLGQYGFSSQIGQKPVPPGGGMFKVDHFQIVDSLPFGPLVKETVRYWDKAGTVGAGCFTVGVKMSSLLDGKFIILDVKRGQWGTEERERIIRATAEADGRDVTVYHEQEPGSGGKESAEATTRNLAGYMAYADRPTGDKVFRADPFSVQVNNDNVMLLRGDWNKVFIDELEYFPFSKYKDQVDSSSGAFSKIVAKQVAGRVI